MANPFTPEQISQILEEFFKVVGTRQYIGARYVPIFGRKGEESIEWDNSAPYEPLTIVLYQGNSYTSRQYVPVGVEITNQEFWAITGNYNAQVELYRQEVKAEKTRAETAEQTLQANIDTEKTRAETAEQTLQTNIENLEKLAAYRFDTLKDLLNETIDIGSICFVSGRITKNIGGGFYRITNNETANGYDKVQCTNGNVAMFIPLSFVTPEQLEQENTIDYAPLIRYTIDYAKSNSIEIQAFGIYNTHTPIVFEYGTSGFNVRIDGAIVYDGTDYAIKIKNTKSSYYFRTINAANGSGIAFDQRDNPYDNLVANHYLEFGEINAKDNGVGFIAANHGVLDIDVQCDISIRAANCYYSTAGTSGTSETPSYASEFHVHGGHLYGSNYAINIEVGSGYECTGHSYCDFSAEGSSKLINLDAGTGTINTIHLENVRIAEIGSNGMITATGNVRECDFYFNHLFMLPWFENNMTTPKQRGCYVHAPINMSGGSYTGFNCAYFSGNGYLSLSDMNIMIENWIREGYQWTPDGTTPPLSVIKGTGTFDMSQFKYFTNNGIPLYFSNDNRQIKFTDGENVLFDGTTQNAGMYAFIKTDESIKLLNFS